LETVFRHFMDQIPADYKTNVKRFANEKILLLKPNTYIPNAVLKSQDYHFWFPTSIPPPSWVGKREYHFHRGGMITIEPEVTVQTKTITPTREYWTLCINKDFFQEIAWQVTGKRDVKIKKLEHACCLQVLQTMARFEEEVIDYNGNCPLMIESICVQMVIQLLRSTGVSAAKDREKTSGEHNYVRKAIEYMHAYFSAGIKIDDICQEINLSPYYFIRLFKADTGKTPHEYLLDIRLQQAEAMLRDGTNSVEEVAYLCGFVSPGHFSSFFRRNVGISPSEYKKMQSTIIFP